MRIDSVLTFASLARSLASASACACVCLEKRYHQYTQTEGNATALEQLTAAGVTLKVDPHIFALHDAKAAFVHLMSGQARGKVVISIRDHADSPKASPAAAAGEGEAGKSAQ